MAAGSYTTSTAFLEALAEAGVRYIFAGAAPFTTDGELPGGRNEFIHWIQDVRDHRGILPAVNRPSAGAAI